MSFNLFISRIRLPRCYGISDPYPAFYTLTKMKCFSLIVLLSLGVFSFLKDRGSAEQGTLNDLFYFYFSKLRNSSHIANIFLITLAGQFCEAPTNSNLTKAVARSMR